jgi:hypothetical protein
MSSNMPEMAWNWPRISPEHSGELSAGRSHSTFLILPSAFTSRARRPRRGKPGVRQNPAFPLPTLALQRYAGVGDKVTLS